MRFGFIYGRQVMKAGALVVMIHRFVQVRSRLLLVLASCRIEVEGIDELYQHIKPLGILHPNTSLKDQWWDERDFAVIDPDNNLISFFQQIKS